MKIGLIDVDGRKTFPNLALMKIVRYHKERGDAVEWFAPFFTDYDKVYMSKVFTHSEDYGYCINAKEIIKGGTGYDYRIKLPTEIDRTQPLYTIYPQVDGKTAYGFLTRGCPNKCPWCIVPLKEGGVKPYMDIEEICIEGRNRAILMDNNVLASDYGLEQIEKIIKLGIRIDFNQAMDARLVTDEIAKMLAKTKWINYMRFGCDTTAQVSHCERAIELIRKHGYNGTFFLYTILNKDFKEAFDRINHIKRKRDSKILPYAQPYLDLTNKHQLIPQWQKDMARWINRKEFFKIMEFADFEPRKGFKCKTYLDEFLYEDSKV